MPTVAENRRITAHRVRPARASAVASNNNNNQGVVDILDFSGDFAGFGNVNHRRCDYVLTDPPTSAIIPNPQVGDRAFVFTLTAGNPKPTGYGEYHYTGADWEKVAYD